MIKISAVQEELENVRRAVLYEANEGLDCIGQVDCSGMNLESWEKVNNIGRNLREILKIMDN